MNSLGLTGVVRATSLRSQPMFIRPRSDGRQPPPWARHRFSGQRVVAAAVLAAFIPVAVEISALATLAVLTAALSVLIAYETVHFAELRDRLRHQLAREAAAD